MTCPDTRFPSHGLCRLLEINALLSHWDVQPPCPRWKKDLSSTKRDEGRDEGRGERCLPTRDTSTTESAEDARLPDSVRRSIHSGCSSKEEEDGLSGASSAGDDSQGRDRNGSMKISPRRSHLDPPAWQFSPRSLIVTQDPRVLG